MTIADIIALAKQGYKPGDIKELIELSKEAPADPQPEAEQIVANVTSETEKTDPEPQPDFAAEIEKLKAENEKIKADLLAAQEENRRQPNPEIPQQTLDDKLTDIAKAFMR